MPQPNILLSGFKVVLTYCCFICVIFSWLQALVLISFSFALKLAYLVFLPVLVDFFTLHLILFTLNLHVRPNLHSIFIIKILPLFSQLATHNYFFVSTLLASRPSFEIYV